MNIDYRDRTETVQDPDDGEWFTVRIIGGIGRLRDGSAYAEDIVVPLDASDQQVEAVKRLIAMGIEAADSQTVLR